MVTFDGTHEANKPIEGPEGENDHGQAPQRSRHEEEDARRRTDEPAQAPDERKGESQRMGDLAAGPGSEPDADAAGSGKEPQTAIDACDGEGGARTKQVEVTAQTEQTTEKLLALCDEADAYVSSDEFSIKEDPECHKCGRGMSLHDGDDPTGVCDHCAQEAVRDILPRLSLVLRLEAEWRTRTSAEVEALKAENAKLCATVERLDADNRKIFFDRKLEGDALRAELAQAKEHAALLVAELAKAHGAANDLRAQLQQSQARSRVERARDRGRR